MGMWSAELWLEIREDRGEPGVTRTPSPSPIESRRKSPPKAAWRLRFPPHSKARSCRECGAGTGAWLGSAAVGGRRACGGAGWTGGGPGKWVMRCDVSGLDRAPPRKAAWLPPRGFAPFRSARLQPSTDAAPAPAPEPACMDGNRGGRSLRDRLCATQAARRTSRRRVSQFQPLTRPHRYAKRCGREPFDASRSGSVPKTHTNPKPQNPPCKPTTKKTQMNPHAP